MTFKRLTSLIVVGLLLLSGCQSSAHNDRTASSTNTALPSLPQTTVVTRPSASPSGNVSLIFPTTVYCASCFEKTTVTAKDAHTLQFDISDHGVCDITLSDDEINELNALFTAVTDFSTSTEMWSTSNVYLTIDERQYIFDEGLAIQPELNWFIDLLREWESIAEDPKPKRTYDSFSQEDYLNRLNGCDVCPTVAPIYDADHAVRTAKRVWDRWFSHYADLPMYVWDYYIYESFSVYYDETYASWLIVGAYVDYDAEEGDFSEEYGGYIRYAHTLINAEGDVLGVWIT